jgi:hypothetical protein
VVLAGILDALGNVLYVLAAYCGHLDITAILSSLYLETRVWLSALVLQERVMHINFPCRAEALVAVNNRRVKYLDGTERKKASHGVREQGRQNLNDGQAKASETT